MEGWVRVYRKLSSNWVWNIKPFSPGQAWIDLLILANHNGDSKIFVRGIEIQLQRGFVGWSEVRLAERWGWSRSKLRKFLSRLEKEQQIIQQKNNVTLIISIVNYDQYQGDEQQKEQQKNSRKTAERQQKDTNKNDKEIYIANLSEREQKFRDSVAEFKGKFEDSTLAAFFRYWSEHSKDGKKMRWESEKTWELSKRLITWYKRELSFKKA